MAISFSSPNGNDGKVIVNGADRIVINTDGTVAAGVGPQSTDNSLRFATTAFVQGAIGQIASNIQALSNQPITAVTNASCNVSAILMGGKVYTTSGNVGWQSYATGRNSSGANTFVGLDTNLKEVYFSGSQGTNVTIVQLAIHGGNGLALDTNGNLYGWGYNHNGELGLGTTTFQLYPVLIATNVAKIIDHPSNNTFYSDQYGRTIYQDLLGKFWITGSNNYGACGVGSTVVQKNFICLNNLAIFVGKTITGVWNLGTYTGCVAVQTSDNHIYMAGYNGYGQLGNGNTTNQTTFVDVTTSWGGAALGQILQISMQDSGYTYDGTTTTAYAYTTIIMLRGDVLGNTYVYSCGYNGYGTIGNNSTTSTSTPYLLYSNNQAATGNSGGQLGGATNKGVKQIAMFGGLGATAQILFNEGSLYAWGYNAFGQVGNNATSNVLVPQLVQNGVASLLSDGWTNIYNSHFAQAAILMSDGSLRMCGYNAHGELGIGNTTDQHTYQQVLLPPNVSLLQLGCTNSGNALRSIIYVTTKYTVFVWGSNANYEISQTNTNNVLVPVQISLPKGE